MQAAKDSFYMALRARLAALNPARTVTIDGVTGPGILVRENLEPRFNEAQAGVFYVDFGELLIAESTRPMLGMDCQIWYASEGTAGGTGVDRGRMLAEMDKRTDEYLHSSTLGNARLHADTKRRPRIRDFLDGAGN